MEKLFTSYNIAYITIANRIGMDPMTRSRAAKGDKTDELTATYFE